jgi:hypothetical protein
LLIIQLIIRDEKNFDLFAAAYNI